MSSQNQGSGGDKCNQILSKFDIFSYIPVPHAYPISSTKSKIGSIVFILIVLGYFIYDFVKFITDNNPVVNLYFQNTPNNVKYQMPNVAFAFIYGNSLNNTLNDPTYLTFLFQSISGQVSNDQLVTTKSSVPLLFNCNPSWLGQFNAIYRNLTCLSKSIQLMNPPLKRLNSITQRLTISLCNPSNQNNITCQNSSLIAQMMASGRLIMIVKEPQGFNFKQGVVEQSDNPFAIYQFFLVPALYNRINVLYYPFNYVTYPTYLTTFTNQNYFFFKTLQPVSLISNVSVFNSYLICSVTFSIAPQYTQVEVHYQTIIEHVSMWAALASLIFTVMAICCLAYNKNKFLKKNPSWKEFDKTVKKKIELDIKKTIQKQSNQQYTGISSIRKQVQMINQI